jgi:hypothetical protein
MGRQALNLNQNRMTVPFPFLASTRSVCSSAFFLLARKDDIQGNNPHTAFLVLSQIHPCVGAVGYILAEIGDELFGDIDHIARPNCRVLVYILAIQNVLHIHSPDLEPVTGCSMKGEYAHSSAHGLVCLFLDNSHFDIISDTLASEMTSATIAQSPSASNWCIYLDRALLTQHPSPSARRGGYAPELSDRAIATTRPCIADPVPSTSQRRLSFDRSPARGT